MNESRTDDSGDTPDGADSPDLEGSDEAGERLSLTRSPMEQAALSRVAIAEEEAFGVPLTPGPARPPDSHEIVAIRQLSKEHLIGLLEVAQETPARSSTLGIQVGWTNGSTTYVPSVADMQGLFEVDAVQSISTHYSFPDKSALHMTLLKGAVVVHSGAEGTQARHRHGAIKAYLDDAGALTTARRPAPWLLIPIFMCFAMAVYTLATGSPSVSIWWSAAAIALEIADRVLRKRRKRRSDAERWLVHRYPAARSSIWASPIFWSALGAIVGAGSLVVGVLALIAK